MLKWTDKRFLAHAEIEGRGRNPKPFPGVDPIRWRVRVNKYASDIPTFYYLGKPNALVANFVYRIFQSPETSYYIDLAEFDRNSVFLRSVNFISRIGSMPSIGAYDEGIVQYYRPFEDIYPIIWGRFGLTRNKLALDDKKLVCYTTKSINVDEGMWQRHKRWLENSGYMKSI